MRFTLLRFAIIASSILAVCPVPVPPAPPVPGPVETGGSSSAAAGKPQITFVDLNGVMIPKAPKENTRAITTAIGDATGLDLAGLIKYDGSSAKRFPLKGLSWIFFKLEGLSELCTLADPCHGWMVKDGGFRLKVDSDPETAEGSGHLEWYVGISKWIEGPQGGHWERVENFE
ncbi:hypothetical protein BDP27DRAFT_1451220, partial [Rhodocollybia butyracea]